VSERLAVNEVGDLVNGLRGTATRIQEASARLEKETAVRKAALTRQGDAELEKLLEEQKARRDDIKGNAGVRLANLEKRTAARKTRIMKAHATSRKKSLERIDEVEGRRKFSVQKGILDTEKGREQKIAELDSNWAAYQQESANFQYQAAQLRESARKSFRAYLTFPKLLRESAPSDLKSQDQNQLLAQAASNLKSCRARVLPEIFRFVPIWLWWAIAIGLFVVGPARAGLLGLNGFSEAEFRQMVGGGIAVVTVLYLIGWALAAAPARATARYLRAAEETGARALQETEQRYVQESEQTRSDAANKIQGLQQEWESAVSEAAEARKKNDGKMEAKMQRALQRNEQAYIQLRRAAEDDSNAATEGRNGADETATTQLKAQWQGRIQQLETEYQTQRNALQREWEEVTGPALRKLADARKFAEAKFAPWSAETQYAAAESSLNVVKFGRAKVAVASPLEAGKSLEFDAPLMLSLPNEGSLLIESDEGGREKAIEALNNIVYRVLQTVPPGKAAFTLIDPVRLGQSFSSIMHLADFEENIVNRRIWTEPAEIEERLLELNSHMEKVIQMYLRNEFRDIVEYNREAGRIAEKYHFLVVADFPANFTETAMRRLVKIAASGARCGVFLLMQWDKRHAFIPGFEATDFTANSIHLVANRGGVVAPRFAGGEVKLELDRPPEPEVATRFLQEVGEASRGSNTVQVPFAQIAPEPNERWSLQTTEELRVPIGRSGATKLQYFTLGKGTRQHVLIAGKTGSGKSTLLHVLVTNLALWSSPDQVEF